MGIMIATHHFICRAAFLSSFCGDQVGKFVGSNTNHTTHHATSLPGALKSRESLDGKIILLVPFYFLAKG